jgi:hypothetical protein
MPPMSASTRRLVAISVLILSVAMVAILSLRGRGFDIALGPLARPTPIPAAPSPGASVAPSASQDPAVAMAAIEAQVRELRGLPDPSIGPARIVRRADLSGLLTAIFDRDWPPDRLAAEDLTLHALGLLTAAQEIRQLTERLYADQVLGFYDPTERRMVVVSDAGLTPEARITYAHEYTHALQDAAFDINAAKQAATGEDDRDAALVALEEGDASTAMVLWAMAQMTPEELLGITQTPIPSTTGIPGWMVKQLEFPYLAGAAFVERLYASGGWAAVNAAYSDLPASTEQILHPDKYVAHEVPATVTAPPIVVALGSGWTVRRETTLGEAWIGIWLAGIGADQASADQAAAGWGGDRIAVASGPGGAWALAWRISWDAPIEAREFATAYATASAKLPFVTRLIRVSDTESIVLHASSAAVLDRLAAGV